MIRFINFSFSGDKFYQTETVMPLGTPGLTLLRGTNFDAMQTEDVLSQPSNGTGKTRLIQILEGFIYGRTSRGTFKKMVSGNFCGTLEFEDLRTKTHWVFHQEDGEWSVKRNGEQLDAISHKNSDMQTFLQQTIGISRDEWSYFVQIDGDSLRTLIKGKPAERRAYLEEFFNIDAFYDERLNYYKQSVKQLSTDLQLLENDRIRLSETDASLEKLPGLLWLKRQVEFLAEVSSYLSKKREEKTRSVENLRHQLREWESYRKLLAQCENIDFRKEEDLLESERKEKDGLLDQEKKRQELKRFVELNYDPHIAKKPSDLLAEPDFVEPDSQEISAKKVQLAEIREKLSLRSTIRAKQENLPDCDIDDSIKDAEAKRDGILSAKAQLEHKLSVLEKTHGQNECPTCGQDLPDHIKAEDPDQVKKEIRLKKAEQESVEKSLKQLKESLRLQNEIKVLQERYDKYPTYGVRATDAEAEVKKLEAEAKAWKLFRDVKSKNDTWCQKFVELDAKAKAMGYPSLLEIDHTAELKKLESSIVARQKRLEDAKELKRITEIVLALPPQQKIQASLEELENEIISLSEQIDKAAELRGSYGLQAKQRDQLLSQREDLKKRLEPYDAIKKKMKVLEFIIEFYSPAGFKLYDLKQRCKRLVERCNYWSKVFFQEPYEWSLSDNIDDLNLFVKPSNLKNEDPYPVALLSAGERNRAARVLLFAQLEMIPPTKRVNFLFLDEIEANLDETGIKAFTEVAIPKLKETFPERSIVLVSHLKDLKTSEYLDHQWLAERRQRSTKLIVQPYSQRRIIRG